MITGRIYEKNDKWHMVLYGEKRVIYPEKPADDVNKKCRRWICTELPATKKNEMLANKMLFEKIQELENKVKNSSVEGIFSSDTSGNENGNMLFADFVAAWLIRKKGTIQMSTWEKYQVFAERHIIPYFNQLGVTLRQLKPKQISDYYYYKITSGRLDGKAGGLDITSVRGHAALIKAVLNEAVIFEYIHGNPALNVPIPRIAKTTMVKDKNVYMTASEANKMLSALQYEEIYPLVYVALYYGLRKSEVLGLKWDAVDFDKNTMEIKSTVVKNKTIVYKDTTKTASSHETYELLPEVRNLFLSIKEKQKENQAEYGAIYNKSEYIFTQPDGRLYRPDCVTRSFQRALKRHNLPEMRFHDLRHSTASILFDKGWDLESVKAWLRHADIETTSNIYLHISKGRKHLLFKDMTGTFIAPHIENIRA